MREVASCSLEFEPESIIFKTKDFEGNSKLLIHIGFKNGIFEIINFHLPSGTSTRRDFHLSIFPVKLNLSPCKRLTVAFTNVPIIIYRGFPKARETFRKAELTFDPTKLHLFGKTWVSFAPRLFCNETREISPYLRFKLPGLGVVGHEKLWILSRNRIGKFVHERAIPLTK